MSNVVNYLAEEDILPGEEPLDRRSRVRAAIAGSAGNLVEWYDFYAYAFTALYFAASFFPSGDRTAQLLNVAAIYAAGFVIRPVGAWYFGRYADRNGRRAALVASVLLMGAGSLMVGLLPTYQSIGAAAPALLLVARLMQGFSTGGQFGAAATYLSEVAEDRRRGLYASLQFVTLIGGQLAALVVLNAILAAVGEGEMRAWAWRIPFVVGGVLAVIVILVRHLMPETLGKDSQASEAGSLRALARHPRTMLTILALGAAGSLSLYAFTTYMQKFLVNTAGMTVPVASRVMMVATLLFMLFQPLVGALSDRIGRRPCLLIFTGGMTLAAVPVLGALSHVQSAGEALGLVTVLLLILSFYTAISGLFKAELFPGHIRALGVGLGNALATATFGGSAEFVALSFKQAGAEMAFGWYVAGVCGIAFLVALSVPSRPRAAPRIA